MGHIGSVPIARKPRYYTPEQATRTLPLVRKVAEELREVVRELKKLGEQKVQDDAGRDRLDWLRDRVHAIDVELTQLGVEMKDPFRGLLDFRARRKGAVVYLCWCLGEDRVAHWHSLESGFAGRQAIETF